MLLRPWDSPSKSTGVDCHFLLQRIFPTQGSNLGLLHCRQTLYRLSHQGSLEAHKQVFLLVLFFEVCQETEDFTGFNFLVFLRKTVFCISRLLKGHWTFAYFLKFPDFCVDL